MDTEKVLTFALGLLNSDSGNLELLATISPNCTEKVHLQQEKMRQVQRVTELKNEEEEEQEEEQEGEEEEEESN